LGFAAVLSSGFLLFNIFSAKAAFNPQINYQGKLTNSSGVAVADGNYDAAFKLYTVSTGGTAIWTETLTGANQITTKNGLFSHLLGSVTAFSDTSIFNQDLWLGVTIGTDAEMSPRKKFGAVPAAFEAQRLSGKLETTFADINENETVPGIWTFSSSSNSALLTVTQSGAGYGLIVTGGNVGIGTATPDAALQVAGALRSSSITSSDVWFSFATSTNLVATSTVSTSKLVVDATSTLGATTTINGPLSVNNSTTISGNFYFANATGASLNIISGPVTFPEDSIATTSLTRGDMAFIAGSGLTGGGTNYLGGSLTMNVGAGTGINVADDAISVLYGSGGGNAVQGNTQITVTAGTNLSGGGTITLGAGGTVTIDASANPTYTTINTTNISGTHVTTTNLYSNSVRLNYATGTDIVATGTVSTTQLVVSATSTLGPTIINSSTTIAGTTTINQPLIVNASSTLNGTTSIVGPLTVNNTTTIARGLVVYDTIQYSRAGDNYLFVANAQTDYLKWDNTNSKFVFSKGLDINGNVTSTGLIVDASGYGNLVGINTSTPKATVDIDGILRITSTSAPVSPLNGMFYYDTALSKFRCYEAGVWANCVGSGSGAIDGSGAANQMAFWSDADTLTGDANFYLSGITDSMGIGTTTPVSNLSVVSTGTTPILSIFTSTTGAAPSFYVANSGKIGLGTTTPQASLHLYDRSLLIDSPVNPTLAGTYNIAETTFNVYVSGKYAYVGIGNGIKIVDISQPTNPVLEGTYGAAAAVQDIYVSGKYAYAAVTGSGLDIVDISNPNSPVLVGNYNTAGSAAAVYVSGKYAYVADNTNGLLVIDISNPGTPILVGNFLHTDNAAVDVYVSGKYAYVANSTGLLIIDISNPKSPVLTGSTDALITCTAYGVYAAGKYAYITCGFDGLRRIDISNPASPALDGNYDTVGASQGVYVSGKYAYVAANASGLVILDISNSGNPILISSDVGFDSTRGVFVSGKYAYIVGNDAGTGLQIIDIQGADINALTAGNISTNDLTVSENVDIGNNLYVRSGLNVGISGIFSDGPLGIATTSFFGGDMGIGTSTPLSNLGLVGTGTLPILTVYTSTTVNALTVANSGKVGVGTTTPTTTLSIAGTTTAYSILPFDNLLWDLGSSAARWKSVWASTVNIGASTWSIAQGGDGRLMIRDAQNGGGRERLSITAAGLVGINTSTPSYILDIDGAMRLVPTGTAPTGKPGAMYYDTATNKFKCYQGTDWADCVGAAAGSGTPQGDANSMQVKIDSANFGGSEVYWLDKGFLGVGTSSPTSILTLSTSTATTTLTIQGDTNSASYAQQLVFSYGKPVQNIMAIGLSPYPAGGQAFQINPVKLTDSFPAFEMSLTGATIGIGTSTYGFPPGYYRLLVDTPGIYSVGLVATNTVELNMPFLYGGAASYGTVSIHDGNLELTDDNSGDGINYGNISYAGTITDTNPGWPDLAETFQTDEPIEAGDVVVADPLSAKKVKKATQAYQKEILGAVSENPSILLGGKDGVPVAFLGRIYVKVSRENGDINVGDYLVPSSQPGIAMKATKASRVLGVALEKFTAQEESDGVKKIIFFVNPHWIGNDLFAIQNPEGQIVNLSVDQLKSSLLELGLAIKDDGTLEVKQVRSQRIITDEFETTDKITGQTYCIWIENGEWKKQVGACASLMPQTASTPSSGEVNGTSTQSVIGGENTTSTQAATSTEPVLPEGSGSTPTPDSLKEEPAPKEEAVIQEAATATPDPALESVPAEGVAAEGAEPNLP